MPTEFAAATAASLPAEMAADRMLRSRIESRRERQSRVTSSKVVTIVVCGMTRIKPNLAGQHGITSVPGHFRTWTRAAATSAWAPTTEIERPLPQVRLVPDSDMVTLLNHLVCGREKRRWYGETKRLGGLQVDDKLKLGRLHDRQIGRFGTLENPAGVDADLAINLRKAGAVTYQAASRGILTIYVNRRNPMLGRQCGESIALAEEECITGNEKRFNFLLGHCREGRIQLIFGTGSQNEQLLSRRVSRLLYISRRGLDSRTARVDEHGNHRGVGNELL